MTLKPCVLALVMAMIFGPGAQAQVPQSPGSAQTRPTAPTPAPLVPQTRPAEIAIPSAPAPPARSADRPSSIEIPGSGAATAGSTSAAPQGMAALLDGVAMPGVMVPLLQGRENDIPDDRSVRTYVFTVLGVMSQLCGERSPDFALTATGYIAPGLAPGRDAGAAGLKAGLAFLQLLARAQQTGDIRDLAAVGGAGSPPRSQTASEDAALLISRLTCQSNPYRDFEASIERLVRMRSGSEFGDEDSLRFAALMSPEHRRRNGVPDPAVAMRERRLQGFHQTALASCRKRFAQAEFCGCAIERLKGADLDDAAWTGIGRDFGGVVDAARQRPSVAGAVRSCIYAER